MTNQEILDAIRASGQLETFVKQVKREVLPQCSTTEILEALEWGVEQDQVIPAWKSPVGNYVVKPLEPVAAVAAAVIEPAQAVSQAEEVQEDAEDDGLPEADVEWISGSGQRIRVWTANVRGLYNIAVDGNLSLNKRIESVPAKFAEQARKSGVVAMIGRVGITAERKAALLQADRSGARSYFAG